MAKEKRANLYNNGSPDCLIVYGPTASGKSAYALKLAEEMDGVIINADVMQMYAPFPVLTAQPEAADKARAPHRLYGTLPPDQWCDTAQWRLMALAEIETARAGGQTPIITGGTGFYLLSLLKGIAQIPEVPGDIRNFVTIRLRVEGHAALHHELEQIDPASAAKIKVNDTQRLIRALEVFYATDKPLSHWQQSATAETAPYNFDVHILLPERAKLYDNINNRVLTMLDKGALDEIRARMDIDPDWPTWKTHGYREFRAYLQGKGTLDEAIDKTQQATRNYAKRQYTWARHQMNEDKLGCPVRIVS